MKNTAKNNVLKAGFWYTISNFIVKGITFLSMPIFTRIMNSNDIGVFSNITSWVSILTIITTLSLSSSMVLAKYDFKNEIDSYISSNLILSSISVFIFYILVLIFPNFFVNFFCIDRDILDLLFVYLLFCSSIDLLLVKSRLEYNYKLSIFISFSSSILAVIVSLITTLLWKSDPLRGRVYGFYTTLLIFSIIIYFYLLFKGKTIKKSYWKYAFTISSPIIIHLLSMNILHSSDRIMITKIIDNNATALYSVAYTSCMFISLLWNSMNNAWSPWAYDMMKEKKYDTLKSKSKPYFVFFLSIILVYILFAPELLLIIGGKSYMEAKYVMPPVIVGYIFQFVYSLYVNIETFQKKQKKIALGTILAAILNIGLNLLFIPIFGYIAAAFTTLISFIFLLIFHYITVKKLKSDYYDIRFFLKYLMITLFLIPICYIIYTFNVIRYIIIFFVLLIITIFVIKNRKEIVRAIKERKLQYMITLLSKIK